MLESNLDSLQIINGYRSSLVKHQMFGYTTNLTKSLIIRMNEIRLDTILLYKYVWYEILLET